MLKTLSYTMPIMKPSSNGIQYIWLNPQKHNVDKNKKSGKVRIYMNDKGSKRFISWLKEQWQNNIETP